MKMALKITFSHKYFVRFEGREKYFIFQTLHKQHSRDHTAWHFMPELRQLIKDPSNCPECSYTGDKLEVARHLALFHCKLDEFLMDDELVAEKRAKAMSKPKKVG